MDGLARKNRYRDLNTFLRERFGYRVQKIPLDAGFTCPNRDGTLSYDGCIYCDAKGSGTGLWSQKLGITAQIEAASRTLAQRYRAGGFLAYFQAFTNTYASIECLRERYEEALNAPGVLGICVGTRPDCVSEVVLDLLASYSDRWMVWLELGLQSAHDKTLQTINRGHDFATFVHAVEETSKRGILTCAHLVVGLPGEGPNEVRETARRIAPLPLNGVKLHSLYIVRGSKLETLHQEGRYLPWTQAQYIESVCDVIERIPPDWVVQRLTGDSRPHTLVAPRWTLDKQGTLRGIKTRLEVRDTWQGRIAGQL
jgi:radical SAM protein (TIGR01212 family)